MPTHRQASYAMTLAEMVAQLPARLAECTAATERAGQASEAEAQWADACHAPPFVVVGHMSTSVYVILL